MGKNLAVVDFRISTADDGIQVLRLERLSLGETHSATDGHGGPGYRDRGERCRASRTCAVGRRWIATGGRRRPSRIVRAVGRRVRGQWMARAHFVGPVRFSSARTRVTDARHQLVLLRRLMARRSAMGSTNLGFSIDGGMHVQNDAYDTYALNPDQGGAGGASRSAFISSAMPGVRRSSRRLSRLADGRPPRWRQRNPRARDNAGSDRAYHLIVDAQGSTSKARSGLLRPNVAPADATVWGYAVGTYRDVLDLTPEAGRVLEPPDGATWDTLVWGIQFEGTFDICPPPPPAGQTPNPWRFSGISTVYLDYTNGTWLTTAAFSPSPGSALPTPFYIPPRFGSPAPS